MEQAKIRLPLRDLVERHSPSLIALARASGLRYGTLFRVVHGYQVPSERTRLAIARALGVEPEEVWPAQKELG